MTGTTRVIAHLNNNYKKIYKMDLEGASKPCGQYIYLKAGAF